ncbi:MAG TPA: response regulator receiver domain [Solirubrobacteraceae bacterium]|jgi:hypothetical protein
MTEQTFSEQIEAIVDAFLQTVVVVDDEALDRPPEPVVPGAITEVPGRRPVKIEDSPEPEAPAATPLNVHDLDPKLIIDSFARRGLVCSVLSPLPDDDVGATVLPCVERADLVIFDWVLNNDDGEQTQALITEMLDREQQDGRARLRTVAIYTGQDNLAQIATELERILSDYHEDFPLTVDESGLTLTKGPVRITVLAKSEVRLDENIAERAVAIPDLPDALRREFAALSTGLVTGVSLAALAALRADTHRILSALPPRLDSSYLGHRAAQAEPSDSEEMLVGLVTAEIRSVLDDHDVGAQADDAAISRWLDHHETSELRFGGFPASGREVEIAREELLRMLTEGLGDDDVLSDTAKRLDNVSEKKLKRIKRDATEMFAWTSDEAAASNALLSERMAIRTYYRRPGRGLHLGTLVQDGDDILVCVQPRCDSIRLKDVRGFPFLRVASVTTDKGADFMFRVPGSREPLRLRIHKSPFSLQMYELTATDRGAVFASGDGDTYEFHTAGELPKTLRWLGQLKPEFAQKVATDLAHEFGRIGLDEHELMRLSRS